MEFCHVLKLEKMLEPDEWKKGNISRNLSIIAQK
jgi:hypothetical protein